MSEGEAAAAARAEYANDLRDMSDKTIRAEIEDAQRAIEDLEPWLEALIAELEHRAKGAAA